MERDIVGFYSPHEGAHIVGRIIRVGNEECEVLEYSRIVNGSEEDSSQQQHKWLVNNRDLKALNGAGAENETRTGSLRGDGPCEDCGTDQNIAWFTENVFWNAVCPDESPILCVLCFVRRTEKVGYRPIAWRVLPEFVPQGRVTEEHRAKQIARHEQWVQGVVR